MGYAALGGLAAVLISVDPVQEAWVAGGFNILMCLWLILVMIFAIRFVLKNFEKSKIRSYGIAAIIVAGIVIIRITSESSIEAIEGVNPATTGFLGGLGLPIVFSWVVGAFFAAAIVGGIGNPFGAFLGGYVIAFSEIFITYAYKKFFMYILPESMEPETLVQLLSTDYKFAVSFSILVIVLLYRPNGIFKGKVL